MNRIDLLIIKICLYSSLLAVEETKIDESNDVQQSQPVFPNSISTSVICLIDLLFDAELNSNGQSGKLH